MKTKIKYIIKDRFFVTKAKLFLEGMNFDFTKFAISIFPVISLPVNFCLWNIKDVLLFVFSINGLEQNARPLLIPFFTFFRIVVCILVSMAVKITLHTIWFLRVVWFKRFFSAWIL